MSGSNERKLLERSKKGDEIAIGFHRTGQNNPALEDIRKFVDGKAPNLKVKCAIEVDGGSNTLYNYVTRETTPCPDAHVGGSFMLLTCTAEGIKPSELLQPIYDFSDCLSKAPSIWYFQDGLVPKGEYEVVEARLTYKPTAWICSHSLDGTYYVDTAKMLRVIEKLTLPPLEGGNGEIRGMVERDAYFNYKKFGMHRDLNWHSAQAGLVMKVISNMMRDNAFITISGRLERSGWISGPLDDVSKSIVYISLLKELKGDDRIHLAPAGLPVWLYLKAYMTWAKNRPGDD